MQKKNILIIQGHPDKNKKHYGHSIAEVYKTAAEKAGHNIRQLDVADMVFPLLRSKEDFDTGEVPLDIKTGQEYILWAEHIVMIYPLWLGTMPALLKGFFEQIFRPGFAMQSPDSGYTWKKSLKGKSARIIVTMGMPAFFYRWFFRAHSLKNLQHNILQFCGIRPVRSSLIGMVDTGHEKNLKRWLNRVQRLAAKAI